MELDLSYSSIKYSSTSSVVRATNFFFLETLGTLILRVLLPTFERKPHKPRLNCYVQKNTASKASSLPKRQWSLVNNFKRTEFSPTSQSSSCYEIRDVYSLVASPYNVRILQQLRTIQLQFSAIKPCIVDLCTTQLSILSIYQVRFCIALFLLVYIACDGSFPARQVYVHAQELLLQQYVVGVIIVVQVFLRDDRGRRRNGFTGHALTNKQMYKQTDFARAMYQVGRYTETDQSSESQRCLATGSSS